MVIFHSYVNLPEGIPVYPIFRQSPVQLSGNQIRIFHRRQTMCYDLAVATAGKRLTNGMWTNLMHPVVFHWSLCTIPSPVCAWVIVDDPPLLCFAIRCTTSSAYRFHCSLHDAMYAMVDRSLRVCWVEGMLTFACTYPWHSGMRVDGRCWKTCAKKMHRMRVLKLVLVQSCKVSFWVREWPGIRSIRKSQDSVLIWGKLNTEMNREIWECPLPGKRIVPVRNVVM